MAALVHSRNVLQQQIMVAETVKSYPVSYPALIPLSPSLGGIPGYSSCSASSLLQNAYSPSAFSPTHRMEQRSSSQSSRSAVHDTPVGLSPTRMSVDDSSDRVSSSRKQADIFSQRKQREFIPDNKKDESYWDRRRRNNEAAKRSREKRRFNDMVLEQRVLELSKENHLLKAQLNVINERYGIQGDNLINTEQVLSTMPQAEQLLALGKRNKISPSFLSLANTPTMSSLLSPNALSSTSNNQYSSSSSSSQMSPSPPPQYDSYSRSGRQSPDFYHHRNVSIERDEEPEEEMEEIPSRQEHLHQVTQYADHRYQDVEKQPTYYEQKALNLSRTQEDRQSKSSPSPSFSSPHNDYPNGPDVEMTRHSPLAESHQGSCLPHKLRHKTHLGDKDAAQSLLALHGIKPEPRDSFNEADDSTSSDERDSAIGMSSSSSPTNISDSASPNDNSRVAMYETLEHDNNQMKNQIQQLSSEMARIKYHLVLNNSGIQMPCDTDTYSSR